MTALAWAAAGAVVVLATVVQAATGMGFGIVAVPLLVLVAPELGIVAVLAVTVVVMVAVVWRERHWLDRRDLGIASAASVPGILVGAGIAAVTPEAGMHVAVGLVVAAASTSALVAWSAPMTVRSVTVAGSLAGALTSIAALPGPPMAIVYRPDDVRTMRATLSAFFAVASVLSIASLSLWGGGTGVAALAADVVDGLALSPAVMLGAVVAGPVVRALPAAAVRRGALVLSLLSGLALAARGLWG